MAALTVLPRSLRAPYITAAAATAAVVVSSRSFMSAAANVHGLGLGSIRTGVDAVHRVKGVEPKYLKMPKTVSIIGAPMVYGQPLLGPEQGPKMLRAAGLHDAIKKLGWRVDERGDLDLDSKGTEHRVVYEGEGQAHNSTEVGNGNKKLATEITKCAEKGRLVLTLGGDHSIGIGTLAGMLRQFPDLGVVWVDAHADINTPRTSGSGNMHGMPLSFILGLWDPTTVPGLAWLKDFPKLNPKNLVYIGLRDVDKGERDLIHEHKIAAFTMSHIDRYGIGGVMKMATDYLGDRPLHLSYDIDACDPSIAPCTGTLVRGGLTFREAHYVAEHVAETGRLVSMDMVEVNPQFSEDNVRTDAADTANLGLQLIASALGNSIL